MRPVQITEDSLHEAGSSYYGFFVYNPGVDNLTVLLRKGTVTGDIIGGAALAPGGTSSLSLDSGVSTNGVYVEKVAGTGTVLGCIFTS